MKLTAKTISLSLSALILSTSISLGGCAWWLKEAPVIDPVIACLSSELLSGAITDPILLVGGCAGATLTALASLLGSLISAALPSQEAGVVAGEISPYVMRLLVIQQHTQALLAAGVK
jgi:hypothetical protein